MGSILWTALTAADTFLERAPNIAAVVGLFLGLWNWRTRRQDKAAAIVEAANVKGCALAQAETQRRTTFELETPRMFARLLDETNVAIDQIYNLTKDRNAVDVDTRRRTAVLAASPRLTS